MVTENEGHRFLLKMDSVGPKLHQISPKKLRRVYNIYAIVLQFYIYCCEVLCSCSGQDSYERDKDTTRDTSKFKLSSAARPAPTVSLVQQSQTDETLIAVLGL